MFVDRQGQIDFGAMRRTIGSTADREIGILKWKRFRAIAVNRPVRRSNNSDLESLVMSKPNDTFHRDASNRLTFDIYKVKSDRYPRLCKELETELGLKPASELVVGLDEMFRDYTDGEHTVGLEWDIWSGFIVVTKDPESEQLVRQIAEYLSNRIAAE